MKKLLLAVISMAAFAVSAANLDTSHGWGNPAMPVSTLTNLPFAPAVGEVLIINAGTGAVYVALNCTTNDARGASLTNQWMNLMNTNTFMAILTNNAAMCVNSGETFRIVVNYQQPLINDITLACTGTATAVVNIKAH